MFTVHGASETICAVAEEALLNLDGDEGEQEDGEEAESEGSGEAGEDGRWLDHAGGSREETKMVAMGNNITQRLDSV